MSADRGALIGYRLQRAREALVQAEALAEVHQPTGVVNRAYYAMFYATLAVLLTKGMGASKHSGAIPLFDREFVKPGLVSPERSKSLHKAFKLRNRGDYDDLVVIGEQEASDALTQARDFVRWAEQWLKEQGYVREEQA